MRWTYPSQPQLVRQEIFEHCMNFVSDMASFASDLESFGEKDNAEDLRSLASEVENCYYRIRDRSNKHSK